MDSTSPRTPKPCRPRQRTERQLLCQRSRPLRRLRLRQLWTKSSIVVVSVTLVFVRVRQESLLLTDFTSILSRHFRCRSKHCAEQRQHSLKRKRRPEGADTVPPVSSHEVFNCLQCHLTHISEVQPKSPSRSSNSNSCLDSHRYGAAACCATTSCSGPAPMATSDLRIRVRWPVEPGAALKT